MICCCTRQCIPIAASRLFFERDFENVTVDEITAAAIIGRIAVFNYYPRKVDMLSDRNEEGREILLEALRRREPHVAPIETLRMLAHRLAAEDDCASGDGTCEKILSFSEKNTLQFDPPTPNFPEKKFNSRLVVSTFSSLYSGSGVASQT